VQLYIKHENAIADVPLYALKAFKHISLDAGESKKITFDITPEILLLVNEKGESIFVPGTVKIFAGGSLPIARSKELGAGNYLFQTIQCN
jgi:beta-glucosidase